MQSRALVVSAVLLAMACAPAYAAAPPHLADAPGIASQLDARLGALTGTRPDKTPALSVAIVQDGRITYARGFGSASPHTRFRIGSITKMFTALAIMQLVEQHRVKLDAKVSEYLPDVPHATEITVRELLDHTSGLWNYGDAVLNEGKAATPVTPRGILAYAGTHPLDFPPGSTYSYSNTGYVVLGLIVERVTGTTLHDDVRERILEPAGMHETTFDTVPAGAAFAAPYMSGDRPYVPGYDPSWFYAGGDMISTASDLARFDLALLDGKLVSPATFHAMIAGAVPTDAVTVSYGLGVMVVRSLGKEFVGHHGGVPGYAAENEMIPADRFAMIVLSDAFNFMTAAANNAIYGTIFGLMPVASNGPQLPEDRAVTARFEAALRGILSGSIDRSQFNAQTNAALTPAVVNAARTQLAPLGAIARVTYLGGQKLPSGALYSYRVVFANGSALTWNFGLDAAGKITTLGSGG